MHINIPQRCWAKMGEVFSMYAQEMPASDEEEVEGEGEEVEEGAAKEDGE